MAVDVDLFKFILRGRHLMAAHQTVVMTPTNSHKWEDSGDHHKWSVGTHHVGIMFVYTKFQGIHPTLLDQQDNTAIIWAKITHNRL